MVICEYYNKCPGIQDYEKMLNTLKNFGNVPAERKFRQLLEKHKLQFCSSEDNQKNCPHLKKLEKITN